MKGLYCIVLSTFVFFRIFAQSADLQIEAPLLQTDSQEIASLEITPLLQQPLTPKDAEIPPSLFPPEKHPWAAVGLSVLFPGLGHFYLDDMTTAGCLTGAAAVCGSLLVTEAVPKDSNEYKGTATMFMATSGYGLYAAYRDVRRQNKLVNYSYQMPQDSFLDLALAPFSWSVIKKGEVWGGILGALGTAIAVVSLTQNKQSKEAAYAKMALSSSRPPISPLIAFPVGLGEETLFRGFIQSAVSEMYSPLTGTIVSSILFGAAHIGNASALPKSARNHYYAVSVPLIASIGAYCGWLTHKNHSLKESVAFHAWYDFIIFASLAAAQNQTAAITTPSVFSFATSF